ncbi:MAG: SulP family inorganic anion transporter [Pirellulaceae bacterium]|nr:SulP family inorganic anion transporter [Pirellulaceae bacterium]
MKRLLDNFRFYAEHLAWQKQEVFSRSAADQKPLAVLVACSDSRILPETILRLDPGELFIIRNAGNMIDVDADTSGELASIEYAVKVLEVQDVIICGHYHCGAIRSLIANLPLDGFDYVPAWLKNGQGAITRFNNRSETAGITNQEREDATVEANVLEQVSRLKQIAFIQQLLAEEKLRLYAWVLRFETNELLSYDPHAEQFVPILDNPMSHPVFPVTPDCCSEASESLARDKSRIAEAMQATSVVNRRWPEIAMDIKNDVIASIGLFCVSLPFCVAIAQASNVSLASGITSALVGSWLVTAIAGNRVLVSGPSSSLIAISSASVLAIGIAPFSIAVVGAGVMQILMGVTRLGPLFRAASPALILGLLAGIGASLLVQQLHLVVDEVPHGGNWRNLIELPMAIVNIFREHGHIGHRPAAVVGVITFLGMWAWERKTTKGVFTWIPSVLVGVLLAVGVKAGFQLPIDTVRIDSGLVSLIDWNSFDWSSQLWWSAILPTALALALTASSESMLTLIATQNPSIRTNAKPNRELVAQGVGNVVSGAMGGLPIAIALVRSQVNMELKARSFLSVALHGLWFVLFIGAIPFVLARIPTAALAAVLAVTGYKMINLEGTRTLYREHRTEGIICLITALCVFSFGILIGVGVGLLVSILALLHVFSRLRIRIFEDQKTASTVMVLEGTANFLRLPKLTETLDGLAQRASVRIETSSLSYLDHAMLSALETWTQNRVTNGLNTEIDLETLNLRFRRQQPRPRQG